jgi:hypothetical protein
MGDEIDKWLGDMNKWDKTVGDTLGIGPNYTYIDKFNAWENKYKLYQTNLLHFVMNTNMNTVEEILNENSMIVNKESFIKVLNIFFQQLIQKSSIIIKSRGGNVDFLNETLFTINDKINKIIDYLNDEDVLNHVKVKNYYSLANGGLFFYTENKKGFEKNELEYFICNSILVFINNIVKKYNIIKIKSYVLENDEMIIIKKSLTDFAIHELLPLENFFKDYKDRAARPAAPAAPAAPGAPVAPVAPGAPAGQKPPKKGFFGSSWLFSKEIKPPNSGKSRKTLKVSERRKNTRKVV